MVAGPRMGSVLAAVKSVSSILPVLPRVPPWRRGASVSVTVMLEACPLIFDGSGTEKGSSRALGSTFTGIDGMLLTPSRDDGEREEVEPTGMVGVLSPASSA